MSQDSVRVSSISNAASACGAFPFGLAAKGLHELIEGSYGDMAAITGLAAALAPHKGAILWVGSGKAMHEHGYLSEVGAQVFGKRAQRYLAVRTRQDKDTLWVVDESVRSRAVACVIAEVESADFTATRRLKLAAEQSGVPVVLLMPHTREGASACETRWRVSSLSSASNPYDYRGVGKSRWRMKLERSRAAPHRVGEVFDLEYDDETLSIRLVSGLVCGAIETVASAYGPSGDIRRTG